MAHDVFVSVGRARSEQQDAFLTALETVLREEKLEPRVLGRNEFSADQPLAAITRLVDECAGTIVIAFSALRVTAGQRHPGSAKPKEVADLDLATPWPQIVGATAAAKRKPLLVVCEKGLDSEGILEARHDWFVQWVELDPEAVRQTDFLGVLRSWREKLDQVPAPTNAAPGEALEPDKLTLGQLFGMIRIKDAWAVAALLATAFAAVWGAGMWAGKRMASADTPAPVESTAPAKADVGGTTGD